MVNNNLNSNEPINAIPMLIKVGGVLSIITGAFWCLTIIGLIWGIPMIILGSKANKTGEVNVSLIVLSIFFALIPGVLLLIGVTLRENSSN